MPSKKSGPISERFLFNISKTIGMTASDDTSFDNTDIYSTKVCFKYITDFYISLICANLNSFYCSLIYFGRLWKQAFYEIFYFPGSQKCHNTKQGYTECRAVCGCFGNMSSNEIICCHFSDKKSTNFCSNGGKTEKIKAKIEQGMY